MNSWNQQSMKLCNLSRILSQSAMRFSNTSGTYEAFLKDWDRRALKQFAFLPIEIFHAKLKNNNEIYNDDEWFLEILNENLKYDLEYLRESMELVIDSYKFMGLFCRIHNNFVENNNKDLYKEGFNKLFDRFFYRIKRKKEDASYYLNNYLDNKELLVNFMNNCNR